MVSATVEILARLGSFHTSAGLTIAAVVVLLVAMAYWGLKT